MRLCVHTHMTISCIVAIASYSLAELKAVPCTHHNIILYYINFIHPLLTYFFPYAVPEVSFISKNITVFENVTKVEVCISTRTALAANVTVTAQTELVIGSADETTGKYKYKMYNNILIQPIKIIEIIIIDSYRESLEVYHNTHKFVPLI